MLPRRINGYRRIALLEGRLFCLPVLTWLGALGFSRCAAAQQVIVIVTGTVDSGTDGNPCFQYPPIGGSEKGLCARIRETANWRGLERFALPGIAGLRISDPERRSEAVMCCEQRSL
jgi:hypothetical protein